MLDLLQDTLFTISACAALTFTFWLVRQRLLQGDIGLANRFLALSLFIVAVKIAYVAFFVLVLPEQVLPSDSYRYLTEIQRISAAPWEWNPILGTGPDYQVTPKMGMSYLYGLILFVHGADASIYSVLAINIVISYITCAAGFLLTLRLSSAAIPALTAMFLIAVYPETLFWNARVLREYLTLLLVTLMVYSAVRLFESHRPRYAAYLLALTGVLLLTRAQLALFLPLILIYYAGALPVRAGHVKTIKSVPILVLLSSLLIAGFGFISQQIRATSGRRLFRLPQRGFELWDVFTSNIGSVLSLGARQEYGLFGVLLVPFTLAMFVLLVMTLLRFRRIFGDRWMSAGLMVFLIVSFTVSLALMGLPNIRYRSTVVPLALSLVSVACYYYWRVLRLPRIVLWPVRRKRLT